MIRPSRRLELFVLNAAPSLLCVGLALLCVIPKHMSGLGNFMPLLWLMPIFFWGTNESRDVPYGVAFAVGLLLDATAGHALGFSSLLTVFFLAVAHTQRKYIQKEGFVIQWGYFAVLLAGYQAAGWFALSMLGDRWLPVNAAMLQWALTLCFYPVFHKGFEKLSEHIQHRRWQIIHGM